MITKTKHPLDIAHPQEVGKIPLPPIIPPADRVSVYLERGEYVFDFDVPLPRKKGGPRGSAAAPVPFNRIPAGASYFAPRAKQSTVSSAASAFQQHNPGTKFVTTSVEVDVKYPERGPGVRVWRVR